MPIWRLVSERVATLGEIESSWSLDDIIKANVVLDIKAAVEALTAEGIAT